MNVIVMGGSGFVGSHFADALTEAGHEVTIFDIRPSAYLQAKQHFIQGDSLDFDVVRKVIEGKDVVYNFAGLADIYEALSKPVETVRLNVLACVQQLEACRQAGVKRYVFASSVYVYSESGAFYRASKQACELYVEEYQRQFGLDYVILRFGTLYGRRSDERNSVFRYLSQALKERKITAYGTGDEIREYVHVQDAARIGVDILKEAYTNQSIIVTGHHPMRYKDLLNMIREIVGQDVRVEILPSTPKHNVANYTTTPYNFHPKIAKKLVSPYYLDMGQGLLDCLEEIHAIESLHRSPAPEAPARKECPTPKTI